MNTYQEALNELADEIRDKQLPSSECERLVRKASDRFSNEITPLSDYYATLDYYKQLDGELI